MSRIVLVVNHQTSAKTAYLDISSTEAAGNASRKLNRCDDSCLSCTEKEDNCVSCPITHYSLKEVKILTDQEKQGAAPSPEEFGKVVDSGVSPMNKVITRCVKKCPSQMNGKPVMVNESTRECIIKEGVDMVIATVPVITDVKNFYENIFRLRVQYQKLALKPKKVSLKDYNNSYHEVCHDRGERKIIENNIYGRLVFCKCHKHFTGSNCQLPTSAVHTYQKALAKIIDQLNVNIYKKDQSTRNKFIHTLMLINKFELNLDLIKRMHKFIKDIVQHDKRIESRKGLYNILDGMLNNILVLIHREKYQEQDGLILESGSTARLNDFYDEIGQILDTIENAFEDLRFSHSFLEFDMQHYLTLDTTSFIMAEHRYSDYIGEKGFIFSSPVIEGIMNQKFAENHVFINFNQSTSELSSENDTNKFYLQILNFSTPLFENKLKAANIKPMSNVAYLRSIDPEQPHIYVTNEKAKIKSISIKFALHSLPIEDDPAKALECLGYNFENGRKIIGRVVDFIDPTDEETGGGNDENPYALCEFESAYTFKSYYFMASQRDF